MSGPPSQLNVGDQIAHYRVEAFVARGGMAVIYRARDMTLGRPVALKLIAPELAHDENFRQRFTRESELAASIDHPHIIPVYQAGEFDGMLYIAMRFVDGQDLGTRIHESGALAPDVAMPIFTQVAGALDAAHSRGLVHRDVKPGNILLSRTLEETDYVYLTDFGLTRRSVSATRYTVAGQFLGTIQYVAPEQVANRQIDARTDVYSLACVMYEALSGRPPFVREDEAALLFAHLAEAPAPITLLRKDLPAGFDPALTKALAKEPEARTQSCRELIAELHSAFRTPAAHGAAAPIGMGGDSPQRDVLPAAPPSARPDSGTSRVPPPGSVAAKSAPPPPVAAAPGVAMPGSAGSTPVPSARAVPPAETGAVPPAEAGTVPPAETGAVPPAETETVPPTDTRTVPPDQTRAPTSPETPAGPPLTPPPERTDEAGTPPPSRRRRIPPIAIILSGAAVLALAGVTAVSLTSGQPGGQAEPTGTAANTPSPTTTPPTSTPTTSPPAPGAALPRAAVGLPSQSLVAPRAVNDNMDLYVVDADGVTRAQRLTTNAKVDHAPVLSPDRRTIAYLSSSSATATSPATTTVRVIGADGRGDRRMFKNPSGCVNVDHLAWNPGDPAEVALVCQRPSGRHVVLALRVDGEVLRTIAIPRDMRRVDDPTYSPDGETIAYWASTGEADRTGAIFAIAASAVEPPRRLTQGTDDTDPAWSPEGDRIAFTRVLGPGRTAIYLVDADGTGERPLVSEGANVKPAWAGEGTSIVFVKGASEPQAQGDLFLVDADDGRQPRPLDVAADVFGTPVWGLR